MSSSRSGSQWSIYYGGNGSVPVASIRELRATLERLSLERPPLAVSLESPTGKVMVIGLGRERSVLLFQASDDPPYFQSVGDRTQQGVIVFYYDGHETELSLEAAVDSEAAFRAAIEFFESDLRPQSIEWQEA